MNQAEQQKLKKIEFEGKELILEFYSQEIEGETFLYIFYLMKDLSKECDPEFPYTLHLVIKNSHGIYHDAGQMASSVSSDAFGIVVLKEKDFDKIDVNVLESKLKKLGKELKKTLKSSSQGGERSRSQSYSEESDSLQNIQLQISQLEHQIKGLNDQSNWSSELMMADAAYQVKKDYETDFKQAQKELRERCSQNQASEEETRENLEKLQLAWETDAMKNLYSKWFNFQKNLSDESSLPNKVEAVKPKENWMMRVRSLIFPDRRLSEERKLEEEIAASRERKKSEDREKAIRQKESYEKHVLDLSVLEKQLEDLKLKESAFSRCSSSSQLTNSSKKDLDKKNKFFKHLKNIKELTTTPAYLSVFGKNVDESYLDVYLLSLPELKEASLKSLKGFNFLILGKKDKMSFNHCEVVKEGFLLKKTTESFSSQTRDESISESLLISFQGRLIYQEKEYMPHTLFINDDASTIASQPCSSHAQSMTDSVISESHHSTVHFNTRR